MKKRQLMELAIINGTYRDSQSKTSPSCKLLEYGRNEVLVENQMSFWFGFGRNHFGFMSVLVFWPNHEIVSFGKNKMVRPNIQFVKTFGFLNGLISVFFVGH